MLLVGIRSFHLGVNGVIVETDEIVHIKSHIRKVNDNSINRGERKGKKKIIVENTNARNFLLKYYKTGFVTIQLDSNRCQSIVCDLNVTHH